MPARERVSMGCAAGAGEVDAADTEVVVTVFPGELPFGEGNGGLEAVLGIGVGEVEPETSGTAGSGGRIAGAAC